MGTILSIADRKHHRVFDLGKWNHFLYPLVKQPIESFVAVNKQMYRLFAKHGCGKKVRTFDENTTEGLHQFQDWFVNKYGARPEGNQSPLALRLKIESEISRLVTVKNEIEAWDSHRAAAFAAWFDSRRSPKP